MIRIIFFLLAVLSLNVKAQSVNSGSAIYGVKPNSDFLKGLDHSSPIYLEIKNASKYLEKLRFRLTFNREEALYQLEEMMEISQNPGLKTASKIARDTPIFIDRKSGRVLNGIDFLGDRYLITSNCNDYEWKVQQETKLINGYTCNKATLSYMNKKKLIDVVAYFSPDIPFNYGPKGYCGLPGLILYLEDNNIIYEVKEINLDLKRKNIDFNKKGIEMSRKGLDKFVDSLARATFER